MRVRGFGLEYSVIIVYQSVKHLVVSVRGGSLKLPLTSQAFYRLVDSGVAKLLFAFSLSLLIASLFA